MGQIAEKRVKKELSDDSQDEVGQSAYVRHPHQPKPYIRADYLGQKVQIDVKYVPIYCVADDMK